MMSRTSPGALKLTAWSVTVALLTASVTAIAVLRAGPPAAAKAELVISLEIAGLRNTDNRYVMLAKVQNAGTAAAMGTVVDFDFNRLCLGKGATDAVVRGDPVCLPYNEQGGYCHSNKAFKCEIINPGEVREFYVEQDNHPAPVSIKAIFDGGVRLQTQSAS